MTDWRRTTPPGYDPWASPGGARFSAKLAERACGFFGDCLRHYQGAYAGRPFVLEPWQRAVVGHLWGWRRPDGLRRYRDCLLFVARKNGKTTLAAGLALLLLYGDREWGAQVYSAAAEREQAALVFNCAKQFVLSEPALARRSEIYRRSIVRPETTSFYKAISAEAKSKHGFNASGLVIDEVHAHRDRELIDVLTTSMGARAQPLTIYLTTAGWDRHSICYEIYDYAKKVLDGTIDDPAFLPVVYESDGQADWTEPDVWRAANPNLDVSLSSDWLERECAKAIESPGYENTFRRLHLNQWTEQASRWFSMDVWDRGGREAPDLSGAKCWGGLDLSSTTDLTAFVLVFQGDAGGWWCLPYCWIPAESAAAREKRDRAPYVGWASRGLIETTPGAAIDQDRIRVRIGELAEQYQIQSIAVDRWNAAQLIGQLKADGLDVQGWGQGFASMSAPSKMLEALVIQAKLWHGGQPVLRWCAANCARAEDAAGNIKPDKGGSSERIDAIVALIMALGIATKEHEGQYDGPGIWL